MIKFEMFQNLDGYICSGCGEVHKELIQISEPSLGLDLLFGRLCARRLIQDLQKFMKLHPSGIHPSLKAQPKNGKPKFSTGGIRPLHVGNGHTSEAHRREATDAINKRLEERRANAPESEADSKQATN